MKQIKFILPILIALSVGFILRGCFASPKSEAPTSGIQHPASTYTCSMHPQIKLPKPGKCPICFMDLIPLESSAEEPGSERELTVSRHAAKLMDIETQPVERRTISLTARMVGKVAYDETRVSSITARVAGRIDRLFVDYTGTPVGKGDPIISLYSPDLLTAQDELQQALRTTEKLEKSRSVTLRDTAAKTVEAAREKLRLWGLTPAQIVEIEKRATPADHITIYAPTSGIVVHKNAQEGMYVKTGTKIYTIADLSQVWIKLDAYESDLSQLKTGNEVTFTAEAWPNDTFKGIVEFIDPVLNEKTRTVKIRASAPNPDGKLKPGMFVRAEVQRFTDAELIIPANAPLITGKRAVVYITLPDREKPTFEGREVELGARAGDFYIVKSGLNEGERVVTRGAFKIDAELQLQAKPNMMDPIEMPAPGPQPQTLCPIMGGEISKEIYTDYQGQRIYFCCPGCEQTFLSDPEKHLEKMRAEGIKPEKIHEH
ncbi:efflux RND transporter periplasmic adaptor subunit [Verrucomicrobiota bacterium]